MVLAVNGAARALTYSKSEALGSLVPVLAQSSRCGLAPALNVRCQRGEPRSSRAALEVRLALGVPRWLFKAGGTLPATAPSQRLTNIEATEATSGLSPATMRRSMPR